MKPKRSIMSGNWKLSAPFISENYWEKRFSFIVSRKQIYFHPIMLESLFSWGPSVHERSPSPGLIQFRLFNLRPSWFFSFTTKIRVGNCCWGSIFTHLFTFTHACRDHPKNLFSKFSDVFGQKLSAVFN